MTNGPAPSLQAAAAAAAALPKLTWARSVGGGGACSDAPTPIHTWLLGQCSPQSPACPPSLHPAPSTSRHPPSSSQAACGTHPLLPCSKSVTIWDGLCHTWPGAVLLTQRAPPSKDFEVGVCKLSPWEARSSTHPCVIEPLLGARPCTSCCGYRAKDMVPACQGLFAPEETNR